MALRILCDGINRTNRLSIPLWYANLGIRLKFKELK